MMLATLYYLYFQTILKRFSTSESVQNLQFPDLTLHPLYLHPDDEHQVLRGQSLQWLFDPKQEVCREQKLTVLVEQTFDLCPFLRRPCLSDSHLSSPFYSLSSDPLGYRHYGYENPFPTPPVPTLYCSIHTPKPDPSVLKRAAGFSHDVRSNLLER
jgi:hypothetical protein